MDSFTQLMHSIPAPFNMVLAIVLVVSVLGVVKLVVSEVGKFTIRKRELDFKREMIDRGLEVDEIERLLRSGKAGRDRWNSTSWEDKS